MKARVLSIMICVVLAVSAVLVGCGKQTAEVVETATAVPPTAKPTEVPATEEPPEEPTAEPTEAPAEVTIYDGYYENRFQPEGYDEYIGYFHFYPNGIVYVSLYNDGQYAAGYFEIVEEGVGWDPTIDENDEDFDPTEATTDKKIIITRFDGTEYAVVGYDSEKDMVVNLENYYNKNFTHVLDSGHTDADESGVNVIEYYVEGDEYSLVALKHNGTFQDSVGMIIEGTWEKSDNVYTLTDGDSGDTYTVTVNEDGSATYEAVDGTTQTLVPPQTGVVTLTFSGAITATYGVMTGTTYLYDNDTVVLAVAYAGTVNEMAGTWELAEDYSLNITIEGETVNVPLNYETQLFNDFEYPTSDGAGEVVLVMGQVAAEVKLEYTWVGTANTNVILEMYSDGTCALIYTGMGTVTAGTWTLDKDASPLPAWTIALDETFEDAEIEVTTDYETGFFFDFKNGTGQLEEKLTLPFADYQAAQE